MNILEGIDVEQTWATVRKYAEENKELIRMNEIKEVKIFIFLTLLILTIKF
jgi:hypothetical protein